MRQRQADRRWKRLEESGVFDRLRRQLVVGNEDVPADRGYLKQFGRERERQPDAAVRGGVTRHGAGVQCRAQWVSRCIQGIGAPL